MYETPFWRLESQSLPPTLHKHLYACDVTIALRVCGGFEVVNSIWFAFRLPLTSLFNLPIITQIYKKKVCNSSIFLLLKAITLDLKPETKYTSPKKLAQQQNYQ